MVELLGLTKNTLHIFKMFFKHEFLMAIKMFCLDVIMYSMKTLQNINTMFVMAFKYFSFLWPLAFCLNIVLYERLENTYGKG